MYQIKNEDVLSADLLSVKEANKLPTWILANGDKWWLRSPGYYSYCSSCVYDWGYVGVVGVNVNTTDGNVRPALKISNIQNLEIGEVVKVFGLMAQYIGNDKVLLCKSIFYSRFDGDSNVYATSEVKKRLDEWFKERREDVSNC